VLTKQTRAARAPVARAWINDDGLTALSDRLGLVILIIGIMWPILSRIGLGRAGPARGRLWR
jgi:hypothetical protein